ncbi:YbaK/EbsC family protein [soil metagenome]
MSKLHPQVEDTLQKYGLTYNVFECDPRLADTAAFCEEYGFNLSQSANTIIVALKTNPVTFVCCVILATTKLDVNKKLRELSGKKGSFASQEQTVGQTGMEIGGVVAIGIENMPIYIDQEVFKQREIVMGGGNRSTKVLLNPEELKKLPNVQVIDSLAWLK